MDINKILFEQLNLQGVQNPFTVDEISGSDAVQKETTKENTEIKQQISSALNAEDETSSLQIDNKEKKISVKDINSLYSNITNTNNLINVLSNQAQVYNNEIKKTEEEIAQKSKEYEDLAQEIEEKQKEYEKLINEAESGNDPSAIERANSLGEEIKLMASDLESIKTYIDNLQTELKSKQNIVNTFSSQMNSLSKVQSSLNKDAAAIKETAATSETTSVSAADSVKETAETKPVTETQAAPTRQQVEIKSMEEYTEILNDKFDKLWEKFGDAESCIQYMKNNLGEYMDITGDGRVDRIDMQILDNYLTKLPKCSSSDPVEQQKGRAYTKGIGDFARELRKQTYISSGPTKDTNSYSLEDVENYAKLGGNAHLLRKHLDITSIAQASDWRERLLAAGIAESDLRTTGEVYKKVIAAQEFIKNNPDKVGYAGIAGAYKLVSEEYQHLTNCGAWDSGVEKYNEMWHYSHDDYYNHVFAAYISEASKTDINNDGKFDAKDLAEFSTNIDLDGDGKVSSEEREFLTRVKNKMESMVYEEITAKSIQNYASIDDIITYYDTAGTDADTSEKLSQAMSNFAERKGNKKLYNTDPSTGVTGLTPDGLCGLLNYIGFGVNRAVRLGLQDGTSPIGDQNLSYHNGTYTYYTDDEVTSIMTKAINQASPANTYLHYIQSADLSKEELQSILSKINSSSNATKNKLAEVKTLIEQKLAGL